MPQVLIYQLNTKSSKDKVVIAIKIRPKHKLDGRLEEEECLNDE